MVRRLVARREIVQVVIGKAGTGKTFALEAAREAWEAGSPVVGAAVARRAASELEDGAGIRSTSLHALLDELRSRPGGALPQGTVVVLDEAGDGADARAPRAGGPGTALHGKLVLVGDFRQLPEIEAGGAFGRSPSRAERSSCAKPASEAQTGNAKRSSCCA